MTFKASQEWRLSKESFIWKTEARSNHPSKDGGEWHSRRNLTDLATDYGAVAFPTWLNAKDRLHKVTQWEGKREAGGKKCLAYVQAQLQRHLSAPCTTADISQAFPGWIQAHNTPATKPGPFVFPTTLVGLCFLSTAPCKPFCSVLHLTSPWQLRH